MMARIIGIDWERRLGRRSDGGRERYGHAYLGGSNLCLRWWP
jgi:hypothetical protein